MTLEEIFPHLNLNKRIKKLNIKGISEDSRLVRKGDIFFIRERKNFDIFSILKKIEEKVSVFVGDKKDENKLKSIINKKPLILVRNINEEFYKAVDRFYGFNGEDFKFIGVTGTNGKTTTTHLIYFLLKSLGEKASLVGTVKYYIGKQTYKAQYTTPDYLTLRKIFKKIKKEQCKFVIMEVSSHGIDQNRIRGIKFLRCVFTNLSRDHLDYHKTMKNYFYTKKRLFTSRDNLVSIINIDDFYGRILAREIKNFISYGIDREADLRAKNIRYLSWGSRFQLLYKHNLIDAETKLYGRYNILNILGAVGTLLSLGIPLERIIEFIPYFRGVEGRLQKIPPDIFVDYAHTPVALKKVLVTLREIGYKKIICVFGCGGERDKGKRALMGKVASNLADFSFITSDNPRNEDPLVICHNIEKGFNKKNYSIVLDRKEAIRKAIKLKKRYKNCCVIVAGKGHEDYQIIGRKKIYFKDEEVIKKLVKDILS
jgi:UDP-N-acetylmuramoyl-L-alanyl-D-glutamate--2,6-diaminopimelate ligase